MNWKNLIKNWKRAQSLNKLIITINSVRNIVDIRISEERCTYLNIDIEGVLSGVHSISLMCFKGPDKDMRACGYISYKDRIINVTYSRRSLDKLVRTITKNPIEYNMGARKAIIICHLLKEALKLHHASDITHSLSKLNIPKQNLLSLTSLLNRIKGIDAATKNRLLYKTEYNPSWEMRYDDEVNNINIIVGKVSTLPDFFLFE